MKRRGLVNLIARLTNQKDFEVVNDLNMLLCGGHTFSSWEEACVAWKQAASGSVEDFRALRAMIELCNTVDHFTFVIGISPPASLERALTTKYFLSFLKRQDEATLKALGGIDG